jgi:anti-anti-sigma factor
MPEVGSDRLRGGWYDVVERTLAPGEEAHRFVWHDRKAWWQQEQAILAYLILQGCLGHEDYEKHGREAAAFYNAFFLDHDDGGVYFNVLANGLPYLLGNERLKGSHSMSAYHSTELCYLSATYINLLIKKEPMCLYFKPRPDGFPGRILRVAPDILPKGQRPPDGGRDRRSPLLGLRRRRIVGATARLAPGCARQGDADAGQVAPHQFSEGFRHMSIELEAFPRDGMTVVVVEGEIDGSSAPSLQEKILPLLQKMRRWSSTSTRVSYMSSAGLRMLLLLYRQAAAHNGRVALAGFAESIRDTMEITGFLKFFTVANSVDEALQMLKKGDMDTRIDFYPTHQHGSYKLRPGRAFPFGSTLVPGGVNFSISSGHATSCTLVLFEKGAPEPFVEIPFPDSFRIGNVWCMVVFDLDYERIEYGYRMDGPWDPGPDTASTGAKILLDPYAKAIGGRTQWGQHPTGTTATRTVPD